MLNTVLVQLVIVIVIALLILVVLCSLRLEGF